jgi:hypothetical protein
MKAIRNPDEINSFPFNRQLWLSYHSLKPTNATLITAPIRFIGHEQDTILEMPIEFPNHFIPASDLKRMKAEDQLKATNQRPFASALLANQHQRNFRSLSGMLYRPSNPPNNVLCKLLIPISNHHLNMLSD